MAGLESRGWEFKRLLFILCNRLRKDQARTNLFLISLFSLNLIPFTIGRRGDKPRAITNPSYELHSRGPATLGAGTVAPT